MNERRNFLTAAFTFVAGLLLGYNSCQRSDRLKICCKAVRIDYPFPLEAVELCGCGKIKPLESEGHKKHPAPAWSIAMPFRRTEDIAVAKGYRVYRENGVVRISKPQTT